MAISESGQGPPAGEPSSTDDAAEALVVPEPDLEPGEKVGEFVVDGKLGEGGFGVVFKATHPLIGKQVAIKVLNRQYSSNPAMVSRFVSEARAVNQIRHRHIIDIFSFGQLTDGRQYYVMELIAGQPLDRVLAERGRLPLEEALLILRAVARALDAAHAQGIAHRDLKPENIFVSHDEDGVPFPKLLDFGIAKLSGEGQSPKQHRTRTGAPMGTPHYMSPEQCRGRDVDVRTDIYSFGIVAYQLFTGELPFHGDDFMEIVFKQLSEQPVPPSKLVPELPASMDRAVAWLMRKEASKRPPNLATAMRALEEAAAEAGVVLPVPRSVDRPGSGGDSAPVPRITDEATSSDAALAMAATLAYDPESRKTIADEGRSRGAPVPPRRVGWLVAALVALVVLGGGAVLGLTRRSEPPAASPAPAPSATAAPAPVSAPALAPLPPQPSAPALPTTVTLTIGGVPAGTDVLGPDAQPLGKAPGPIQLARGDAPVTLTLRARGFKPATLDFTPTADAAMRIDLQPVPAAKPRAKSKETKDKNSLEEFE